MKLEEAFQFYMKMSGLAQQPISRNQLIETRRAFVAGISSLSSFIDCFEGTEEEMIKEFTDLKKQCMAFWNDEMAQDEIEKAQRYHEKMKSINPNNTNIN